MIAYVRRTLTITASVVVYALSTLGLPAAASPVGSHRTLVVSDCAHRHYKPGAIILACQDDNFGLEQIHYSYWRSSQARGHATADKNNCVPDCIDGHVVYFKVTFRLLHPKTKHGHRVYTLAKVYRHGKLYGRYKLRTG